MANLIPPTETVKVTIPKHLLFVEGCGERVDIVAQKISEFREGVNQIGFVEAKSRIMKWLGNFESLGFYDFELPLKLLEAIELIPTDEAFSTLTFLSRNILLNKPYITHLGEVSESSYRITANFNSQPNFCSSIVTLLDSVQVGQNFEICFYDDFLNSGGQVVTIFKALLNIPPDKDEINDEWASRTKLNGQQIAKLKKASIHIFYYKVFDEGVEHFENELKKLGLKIRIYRHLISNNNDGVFGSPQDQEKILSKMPARLITNCAFMNKRCSDLTEFYKILAGVGEALLRVNEPDWEQYKYHDRKLGYGNKCRVICTDANIPTVSLTALWHEGEVNYGDKSIYWHLLLPRRKKELGKKEIQFEPGLKSELIQDIIIESSHMENFMISPIERLITAYLSLSEPNKLHVARKIGVYTSDMESMMPSVRDKEIMRLINHQNLLSELWEEVNALVNFSNQSNPFNT